MPPGHLEFEAAADADALIRSYDEAAGAWGFPKEGEFWSAVGAAYERGVRGRGSRVAVIDSAFDLSIPRLRARAGPNASASAGEAASANHGTAVALLINEVAPEAKLDLYSVAKRGRPDRKRVIRALSQVQHSEAKLVNLSLGRPAAQVPFWWRWFRHGAHCDLCAASEAGVSAGRYIVAAVGNAKGVAYCPARDDKVLGIGFQGVRRSLVQTGEGGSAEKAQWDVPSYAQAVNPDYTLEQPEGVLGSSFATPLLTGALALLDELHEVPTLFKALSTGGEAELLHGFLQTGADQRAVDAAREAYLAALSALPHRHGADSAGPPCTMCSIFAQGLYVNAGLFFLETGALPMAGELLHVARWLAPWSPHATANWATFLRARANERAVSGDRAGALGLLRESRTEYGRALGLRPGFKSYLSALGEVEAEIVALSG